MTEFIEAKPMYGYLSHAIIKRPERWHRPTPWMMTTYQRALCGVGSGGMRIALAEADGEPRPWVGIDGCDRCHAKVHKIRTREKEEAS